MGMTQDQADFGPESVRDPHFKSFFMGGFECSTHRRADGRRLDVIAATGHDVRCAADYRLLANLSLRTIRDGFRWHLIERRPGRYDWSSFRPMLEAARKVGVQVIWDLMHYGYPDHVDLWKPSFVDAFARYVRQAARVVRESSDDVPYYVPVNEISFMAWGAGDMGVLHPFATGRGEELKRQLTRAAIAAIDAVREIDPRARFIQVEPIIRVVPNPGDPTSAMRANRHMEAQFSAFDMLCGRLAPELGGAANCLDVIGLNYYCHNQWFEGGAPIPWNDNHPLYRAPRDMFLDVYRRYGRPMIIAETGIEAELRPAWFRHVCEEVREATAAGARFHGICLYPVMNHPGWADDRHCPNGLIDYDRTSFERRVVPSLAAELRDQQTRLWLETEGYAPFRGAALPRTAAITS